MGVEPWRTRNLLFKPHFTSKLTVCQTADALRAPERRICVDRYTTTFQIKSADARHACSYCFN
uniref:Predicted protein n=1 Tax=Hordeum vulgare subsp. vulgare TaxID=112509 RepID=F2D1X9_HORVV|nr:predicted protein [Hordeum vulgare subsp. vulgare]